MWAFFSARLRTWLLLAVGVPVLGWLLGRVGDAVEARRGPNGLSRGLQTVRGWLRRRARGPLARRPADPAGPADAGTPAR
ncbi:MAG TPA: hypothetical protein VM367_07570 [Pseudonocardia sp.]|jgi:hypothetical protein|nr:hypothetical protein [Pseudonocardia sp.]